MSLTTIDRINGINGGLAIKAPCRVATTAAITLSGEQTIDGVAVVAGDRVLVKNQSSGVDNGIYVASTSTWSRDLDFDGARDAVTGTLVCITSGTVSANSVYELTTTGSIVPGTTSLTFTKRVSDLAGVSVSAFASTVLDDTTADAMLTTLGFSTFAKTIIDDTTAAAARTTLGAAASGANSDITGLTGLSVVKSEYIPVLFMRPKTSGGCSALTDNTVSGFQIQSLDFDAAGDEIASFVWKFPNGWNNGTITVKFHWSHAATATNFVVRWVIGAQAVGDGETMANIETAQQAVNDTGGNTNYLYISDATSALTIANTPADGDLVLFNVTRNGSSGADTLAIDARLHGVELFYTVTTLSDA